VKKVQAMMASMTLPITTLDNQVTKLFSLDASIGQAQIAVGT